ncbi:hypothetical protein [Bradyrhizobium erythrophlei]|uniref:Uncharacterized protein n=1 Tax=Bradyrhizobium erythrophlei TaxID=1437360 RepID=A0A1M5GXY6_9BRAD|nr:hypothetical protein [Bradyrhizobium erythrophlei]SHG08590.1 hypothetical protein SAMN05443248_0229 [Bradyrhizobium erythrophlei]
MALFPKASDPQKKAQRDLDAARASRNSLIERRQIAETSAAEHRDKARKLAREGADDQTLSAAELDMRREQDRTATFTGAISDVEATIASLEGEIAQIIDQRCRNETATALTTLADKLAAAATAFDEPVGQLAEMARESALIVLDGHPLQVFMHAVREQVPPTIAVITNGLRDHAKAVLAGTLPPTLPKPAAEPVKPKATEMREEKAPRSPHAALVNTSDPVMAAANFQPLDRGPARKLEIAP